MPSECLPLFAATSSFASTRQKYLTVLLTLLVAAATCFPQSALAQAESGIQRGGPTPHQVFDGSAKLVDHYDSRQMLRKGRTINNYK
jgi:hypothetical protein